MATGSRKLRNLWVPRGGGVKVERADDHRVAVSVRAESTYTGVVRGDVTGAKRVAREDSSVVISSVAASVRGLRRSEDLTH
jgi:hypothetical protein